MLKKVKRDKVDLTLSQVIDKYSGIYRMFVDFNADGTVSVYIGSAKDDVKENANDTD